MESSDDDDQQTLYSTQGKYIVNAVTGVQTIFRVGSKHERRFWKVSDVSLEAYDPSTGAGTTYFFPSPEAYENVKKVKIAKEIKLSWKKRRNGSKCTCLSAHVCNPC